MNNEISEVGMQRAEVGHRKSEVGGRGTEVGGRRSDVRGPIRSAKDLDVYVKAYELAMYIFGLTFHFPAEERFALTSQIRRSSRSVCLNLREAWAKRRYEAHFVSKLTDCDGENSETDSSLDFAMDCKYITALQHRELTGMAAEIGAKLGAMLKNPTPFLIHDHRAPTPAS
jgi:four helix bundle protein